MKIIILLLVLFALSNISSFAMAESYLHPATPEEVRKNLSETLLTYCDEFLASYTDTSPEDLKSHMIEITSYDRGICRPQNLYKAKDMYEALYAQDQSIMMYFMPRLGVIYEFGSDDIRNIDRAKFLYKQSVIYWGVLDNNEKLRQNFKIILLSEDLPERLEEQINWVVSHNKKSLTEQEKVAKQLKAQGFKRTNNLWNESLKYKPIE